MPEAPDPGGPLPVVATTTIVADLVREIGGDAVEVTSLMGPGVDPHLYNPTEGDIARMGNARAIFYNGLHLEGKMTDLLAKMNGSGVETTAIAECVPETQLMTVDDYAGAYDPHVWFDTALWSIAAQCTRDALMVLLPDKTEEIRLRAEEYMNVLEELESSSREAISAIPETQRILVTAHDAFGYFGRAYGIEVRGLLGVSTAAEAGTADVQQLAELIADRKVPAIFVESSVPLRYVQALQQAVEAREFQVEIGGSLYSDALGEAGSPAETYVGTVRHNVETIATALTREVD